MIPSPTKGKVVRRVLPGPAATEREINSLIQKIFSEESGKSLQAYEVELRKKLATPAARRIALKNPRVRAAYDAILAELAQGSRKRRPKR